MVFTIIIDIAFHITVWTIKKMYGISRHAIFGSKKTENKLLLDNQTKIIELLQKDLTIIHKQLNKIENKIL